MRLRSTFGMFFNQLLIVLAVLLKQKISCFTRQISIEKQIELVEMRVKVLVMFVFLPRVNTGKKNHLAALSSLYSHTVHTHFRPSLSLSLLQPTSVWILNLLSVLKKRKKAILLYTSSNAKENRCINSYRTIWLCLVVSKTCSFEMH